jgi:hypothetical protein
MSTKIPILIGTIITILLGEVCIRAAEKHHPLKKTVKASSHHTAEALSKN